MALKDWHQTIDNDYTKNWRNRKTKKIISLQRGLMNNWDVKVFSGYKIIFKKSTSSVSFAKKIALQYMKKN